MQQHRRDNRDYIRKIDFVFHNEAAIRAAVEEERMGGKYVPELRNGSGLPDPTATEAIRNLSPIQSVTIDGQILKYPERWLVVIDKTYNWCRRQGEKYYEVARARYNDEYFVRTCTKLDLTFTLFYRIVERIKMYAALQAAQLNLIYVE